MSATVRNFVFTLNNPDGPITWWPNVRYAVWQEECGASGTAHYQGYVELSKPERFNTISVRLPRAHIERRRGTREEARDYCRKDDTRVAGPFEFGEWIKGPGARTDLTEAVERVMAGEEFAEIAADLPEVWVRNHRGLRDLRFTLGTSRNWKTRVFFLIGPPGCGKSRLCRNSFPAAYWKPANHKWWDGYDGQSDVVIDDFYGSLPWTVLLNICDRYPLAVETKGGNVRFLARNLCITSNADPSTWYDYGEKMKFEALMRRVDVTVTDFTCTLLSFEAFEEQPIN